MTLKSEVMKKDEESFVTDHELITKLIGVDFFKKIGKCKDPKMRLNICSKNSVISKIEYLNMWFVLSLEDRLRILLMIKVEAIYNVLVCFNPQF